MAKKVLFKDLRPGKRFSSDINARRTFKYIKLQSEYGLTQFKEIANACCLDTGSLSFFDGDVKVNPKKK